MYGNQLSTGVQACVDIGGRQQSILQRMQERKQRLIQELQEVDSVIEALEKDENLNNVLSSIQRIGL